MNKEDMVYITHGLGLSLEKERNFLFATTWMDLQDIMLNEINQKKTNTKYHLNFKHKRIKQISEYNKKEIDSQIQRTN